MKITILIVGLLVISGILYSRSGKNLDESKFVLIEVLSKANYKQAIANNPSIQLVDVRKKVEWDKGYIKPAVLIDFFSKDFTQRFEKFDKSQPLYLYCRSGNRSGKAARLLSQEGFTKIYDLEGGYKNWVVK